MRIKKEETLALIIDFQEKLVPVMNNQEQLIKNSNILIKGLKALDIPMIITEQYKKGLGKTVSEITDNLDNLGKDSLDKLTFSCADDEEIMKRIQSYGKKNIIICGIEAHICVLQTIIDLIEKDYQVILVTNCTESRKPEDKVMALRRSEQEGAILTTYESILFELTRRAGSDVFKIISTLIK